MPVFMSVSHHAPENCPMFSEKHRKSTMQLMDKVDSLTKKHGIKMLGTWADFPQHLVYMVFEGSFDAVQKLWKEPEMMGWLSWNSIESKTLLTMEEVSTMLRKAK
jgi:glutaredoxin-related protein